MNNSKAFSNRPQSLLFGLSSVTPKMRNECGDRGISNQHNLHVTDVMDEAVNVEEEIYPLLSNSLWAT